MTERIVLSQQWVAKAVEVGNARYQAAVARGGRHYGKIDNASADLHVIGAIAECAVAKFLRVPWRPILGAIGEVDVGGVVEVRARKVPGSGTDLAIRPKDHDDKPYVHSHVLPTFAVNLIGWLWGYEGKGKGPWCESKGVWFVPPPYRPLDELVSEIIGKPRISA